MDTSHTPPVSTSNKPRTRASRATARLPPAGGGELLAVGTTRHAGRIVWWRLDGGGDAEEFNAARESVGGDDGGTKAAARRWRYAVAEVATAHRHLARPVTGGFRGGARRGRVQGHGRHRDAGPARVVESDAAPRGVPRRVRRRRRRRSPASTRPPAGGGRPRGVRALSADPHHAGGRDVAPAEVRRADGVALRDTGACTSSPPRAWTPGDRVVRAFAMSSGARLPRRRGDAADDAAAAFLDAVSEEARLRRSRDRGEAKLGAEGAATSPRAPRRCARRSRATRRSSATNVSAPCGGPSRASSSQALRP